MTPEESPSIPLPGPLPIEDLYSRCDPALFDFKTTSELHDGSSVIGQERAVEAIRFGLDIQREGFNLFVLGDSGAGRRALVDQHVRQVASKRDAPEDWCYVENFEDSRRPKALRLPGGMGPELLSDMQSLVVHIETALPVAFESEEYQLQQHAIKEQSKEEQDEKIQEIQEKARKHGLDLLKTPMGYAFAPVKEGKVLTPDAVAELPKEEQEELAGVAEGLQDELLKVMRGMPRSMRNVQDQIQQLNRDVAGFTIHDLIEELKGKYAKLPEVVEYLEAVSQDVIDNVGIFIKSVGGDETPSDASRAVQDGTPLRRYRVNVLVDHSLSEHAPIVFEDHPSYTNLLGRIEHLSRMGTLVTDFNLIRAGALHRASGGYLVLDAVKILTQPLAWDALKRALQAREVRIEAPSENLGLVSTVSLEPAPIPIDVKVVLVGERRLYYLLDSVDPEFRELFKVMVDVDESLRRTPESEHEFARLVASIIERESLKPFDRTGVARVLEHSARLAGDGGRISTHRQLITDLLMEADFRAGDKQIRVVTAEHVERAIKGQERRADRVRERMQEEIERGTIYISTAGERIGQINGLAVLQIGLFRFGRPNRITARVRLGTGRIVDIERETELGGAIHSKGVLILSGFIAGRYAGRFPLSLSASMVFEQSYGMIDGDSASVAELVALLSALAEAPIRQYYAVTGSVNQHGDVQPIGGVNEKIEGFFDVCRSKGLNGEQGVLIPSANVKHLMLREDVIEAAREGAFKVIAVETVDQAMSILTGIPAGERNAAGAYPPESLNGRVDARLEEYALRRQRFATENNGKE